MILSFRGILFGCLVVLFFCGLPVFLAYFHLYVKDKIGESVKAEPAGEQVLPTHVLLRKCARMITEIY